MAMAMRLVVMVTPPRLVGTVLEVAVTAKPAVAIAEGATPQALGRREDTEERPGEQEVVADTPAPANVEDHRATIRTTDKYHSLALRSVYCLSVNVSYFHQSCVAHIKGCCTHE